MARAIAQAVLEEWRIPAGAADRVVLVVSELVTNAVQHAVAPLTLHLHQERVGDRIWVGVQDGGQAALPEWGRRVFDRDEHGRGLAIVDALAQGHGTQIHPQGTTHWARLTA
ncbi:ATP-binding protein [Streptomyces chartreusis]|uniref:ATP-binding protein n=1 Tax=Streptomyces chartreusis TaxID=1969 RepID=UPI0036B22D70